MLPETGALPSRSEHRPVHFYVADGCYFISAAILHHQPLMTSARRRDWFFACLSQITAELDTELVAWVILPNHYHAIVRVPQSHTIAELVRRLHGRSARQFNQEDGIQRRQVWYSYWDRCLWTEGDFWSRINYIHRNPVKHGYAATPEDWPHSSWQRFVDLDPESEASQGLQRFPAPRQLPNDP
jgi:REP-associated tyrosine transposase